MNEHILIFAAGLVVGPILLSVILKIKGGTKAPDDFERKLNLERDAFAGAQEELDAANEELAQVVEDNAAANKQISAFERALTNERAASKELVRINGELKEDLAGTNRHLDNASVNLSEAQDQIDALNEKLSKSFSASDIAAISANSAKYLAIKNVGRNNVRTKAAHKLLVGLVNAGVDKLDQTPKTGPFKNWKTPPNRITVRG